MDMSLCNTKFSSYYNNIDESGYRFYNPYKDDIGTEEAIDTTPKMVSDITMGSLYKQKQAYTTPSTEVIKTSTRGYKVFATKDFRKSDIIEIAPVVIQPSTALALDSLKDILYQIDDSTYALVLGNGSLYDASNKSNVEYAWNPKSECMYFVAKEDIKRGTELTIDYGEDYWSNRIPDMFKQELDHLNSLDFLQDNHTGVGDIMSKILFNKSVEGNI